MKYRNGEKKSDTHPHIKLLHIHVQPSVSQRLEKEKKGEGGGAAQSPVLWLTPPGEEGRGWGLLAFFVSQGGTRRKALATAVPRCCGQGARCRAGTLRRWQARRQSACRHVRL